MNRPNGKVILDLCGGTGSWSKPYKDNGYDVRVITYPEHDVRLYEPPKNVYGILAAPPCTMFSFARTNAKKPRDLEGGMSLVIACLRIIWTCQYRIESDQQKFSPLKFWALENPYHGMLRWFLGEPAYTFNPWEFGHNYQKHTALWGYFNHPKKKYTDKKQVMDKETIEKAKTNSQPYPKFDYMKSKDIAPEWFGQLDRQARRSITPGLFAEEFYKVNT